MRPPHAEFLYRCVQRTIERDLPEQTDFFRRYDAFRTAWNGLVAKPLSQPELPAPCATEKPEGPSGISAAIRRVPRKSLDWAGGTGDNSGMQEEGREQQDGVSPVLPPLTAEEVRVLGSLIEKSFTTPDVYPMTINGLVAACNQKSSRHPVVDYDEDMVRRALDGLREKHWAFLVRSAGARTMKFRHEMRHTYDFPDAETALLCVLMLRGPQTVGELRSRTERMVTFETLADTEKALRELSTAYPQPFVAELPRQPGHKETRFAHLLAGEIMDLPEPAPAASRSSPTADRLDALEEEVQTLREEIAALRETVEKLEGLFT